MKQATQPIANPTDPQSYFAGQYVVLDSVDKVRIGTVVAVELVATTNKGRTNKYAGEHVIRLHYVDGRYGIVGISDIVRANADTLNTTTTE